MVPVNVKHSARRPPTGSGSRVLAQTQVRQGRLPRKVAGTPHANLAPLLLLMMMMKMKMMLVLEMMLVMMKRMRMNVRARGQEQAGRRARPSRSWVCEIQPIHVYPPADHSQRPHRRRRRERGGIQTSVESGARAQAKAGAHTHPSSHIRADTSARASARARASAGSTERRVLSIGDRGPRRRRGAGIEAEDTSSTLAAVQNRFPRC